jgi:hypothetical protein
MLSWPATASRSMGTTQPWETYVPSAPLSLMKTSGRSREEARPWIWVSNSTTGS